MRTNFYLTAALTAALIFASSCKKQSDSVISSGGETVSITIKGELGEFENAAKASAVSSVRINWEGGEKVYVYGKQGGIIKELNAGRNYPLTADVVEGTDGRVASLSGEILQPDNDSKLILVCSPCQAAAPDISNDRISIEISDQTGDNNTFVAYSVVACSAPAISELKTSFVFATSLIKVNATGLASNVEIDSVTITNIENSCVLSLTKDTAQAEVAATKGVIRRTWTNAELSNSQGEASFFVCVPITSEDCHVMSVAQGPAADSIYSDGTFALQKELAANRYYNTICQCTNGMYADSSSSYTGYGIWAAGILCAPINCGYDATKYKYGKLYQWGRKDGCGYQATDGTSSYNDAGSLLQSDTPGPVDAASEQSDKFYINGTLPYDWLATRDDTRWNSGSETHPVKTVYDPCPTGWRIPTGTELKTLIGGISSPSLVTVDGQKGVYLDGTSNPGNTGIFFPSAGSRFYGDGKACNRSSYGIYWSSSVSTDYAKSFNFSGSIIGMSGRGRSSCISIRCVHE